MNWLAWLLLGILIGLSIGAAFMYLAHAQAVSNYTLRALDDMRSEWHP